MKFLRSFFIIAVVSYLMLEGFSFLALWSLSGRPGFEQAAHALRHPLLKTEAAVTSDPIPPYRRSDDSNPFEFSSRTGYANRPARFYGASLPIDADGFICGKDCRTVPKDKPDGEYRVMIFGGSTVAGVGVDHGSETIAGQLESVLAGNPAFQGKSVRVINAGVGGFFSGQEIARFLSQGVYYSPDAVIFLNGLNDYHMWWNVAKMAESGQIDAPLQPNLHLYDYQLIKGFQSIQSLSGSLMHTANIMNGHFPILHYSSTLAKIIVRLPSSKTPPNSSAPDAPTAIPDMFAKDRPGVFGYFSNMTSAVGAARRHGMAVMVCLQPQLGFGDKPAGDETEKASLADMDRHSPRKAEFFQAVKSEMAKRIKSKTDGSWCDLTDLFQHQTKPIYVDHGHYNRDGNAAIAQALAERLTSQEIGR